MGLAQKNSKFYTPAEYLELERQADVRHELLDGEIYEMAGANKRHNRISVNVVRLLDTQLLERECSVYGSDMRVKIAATGKYTYPDVVAVCGEEFFEDETEDTLLNPMLIIEVLSKSTEGYDRGGKFEYYQTIESFNEYVLIAQEPFRVEQFVRKERNVWTYFEFRQPDDIVKLHSVNCELVLQDIYHKIQQKFPKEVI
ncbi:MAG: Uma2 family endonuclease [Pyrinomonadaceae bacterium]|nr:Uma2 family endonuclease [Pyrinomonadaceae bacterium]